MRPLLAMCSATLFGVALSACALEDPVGTDEESTADVESIHTGEVQSAVTAAPWAPCIGTRLTHCYTTTRCVNHHMWYLFWDIWSYRLNSRLPGTCGYRA